MKHPAAFDEALTQIVARLPKEIRPIVVGISACASPNTVGFIFSVLGVVAMLTDNDQLWRAIVVGAILLPVAGILKLLTKRRRPETLYVERMWFKTYSFPSGHAYLATMVFGFLAFLAVQALAWGWLIALLLAGLIILVGISRVYLGAHFPSDVVAGWLLGLVMLAIWLKVSPV